MTAAEELLQSAKTLEETSAKHLDDLLKEAARKALSMAASYARKDVNKAAAMLRECESVAHRISAANQDHYRSRDWVAAIEVSLADERKRLAEDESGGAP